MSDSQSTYRFSANPEGMPHAAGGSNPVNSESSSYLDDQYPDSLGADVLSIALIGPDEDRRKAAASALAECQGCDIREFTTYPPSLDDVPRLLEQHHDVIILDLDSHSEYALELVESICANGAATVMVYSMKADSELLVRCMRAGAREFLTLPFSQNTMAEALIRASARRPATRPAKKTGGRLLVFLGAKGGDGVTTLACNFAVSLAQESGQSTVLIDLDLPLGDAALNLGVVAEYSTINALQNAGRLDTSFLSRLLVKHSSGVSVLAAPGKFPQFPASNDAIDRLITVARQDFENVVIDMGSRLDLMGTSLFKDGSTVYLVIQAGIAGLRNSNRLISQYFNSRVPKLEIVINRFEPRSMGVSEDQITKALTRPPQWKIPNDYAAVRRMQNTAIPLALEDSPISRLIRQMARTACGLPAVPEKKGGFSLKSLSRTLSAKISAPEETRDFTQLGLASDTDHDEASDHDSHHPEHDSHHSAHDSHHREDRDDSSSTADRSIHISSIDSRSRESARPEPASEDHAEVRSQSVRTPERREEPQTRSYKGSTYVKGPDGEWHIQETASAPTLVRSAEPETRSYKGSTYVKGPDGSWQLQAAPAQVQVKDAGPDYARAAEQARAAEEAEAAENARAAERARAAEKTRAAEKAYAAEQAAYAEQQAFLAARAHVEEPAYSPTPAYVEPPAPAEEVVQKTPAVAWSTPASIAYGVKLSSTQLSAMASVPGKFAYTPAAGEVLDAGMHTLSVEFTPDDSVGYTRASSAVSLTVTKVTPTIAWSTPAPLAWGTALSAAQLNAAASTPGKLTYNPAMGDVLGAGVHMLSVTLTPADSTNYAVAQATVSLTVAKASPTISWPKPAAIPYGTPLSARELNATPSVPGEMIYSPAAGEVLPAGTHKLSVTLNPINDADYTTAQATISLTVVKATPAISWPTPAPIVYGTPLGATELNASASVPGEFVYIPGVGAVLAAGKHTPSVIFTPADTRNYNAAQAAVPLVVTRALPDVNWSALEPIVYGTALGAAQLNATSSVPGKFVYTPGAGEILAAGTHVLSAIFTPIDATDYCAVQDAVSLTVTEAAPTAIAWPAPAAITHGVALSDAMLNATAPVPGKFEYKPAAGEVLAAGAHTLEVIFTPDDRNFPSAHAEVSLVVNKEIPKIVWSAPASISYGTALSGVQLNAAASVPGTFAYSPEMGEVLTAGTHTLSATFTPANAADIATAEAAVSLIVTKATPIITWPVPAAISYGSVLSAAQLNATALIPGTFVYTPAAGTVLAAGTQALSVTFLPADTADYAPAQASVSLVVEELPNILALMPDMYEPDANEPRLADTMQGTRFDGNPPSQQSGPETRTYKGATYVKGDDGQWYLQKS